MLCLIAMVTLSACSPSRLVVDTIASELATQGEAPESDLLLARDAAAFYLKLSESILSRAPEHVALAEAVSAGFTRYAYAFIAFEAERLEAQDASLAKQHRERALAMYRRANGHALRTLELHYPGLRDRLREAKASESTKLRDEHIGLAYWASASWAASIALAPGNPESLADLPIATRLAELAWSRNPRFGRGALASLLGSLEAARPGGSRASAGRYFDDAIEAGGGLNAGIFVAKAESLSGPAGDREAYEKLLEQAIDAARRQPSLDNEVMLDRARWLLRHADDRF